MNITQYLSALICQQETSVLCFFQDLTSVQNLQKLEADVSSRQERIDNIVQAAEQFVQQGHFDSETIKAKQVQLVERYRALQVSDHTIFDL